jgi:hypothetical protein
MMLWQRLQAIIESAALENVALCHDRPIIYIDSQQQLLCCVKESENPVQYYPVSTSSKGIGQKMDSFQTPAGIHKIAQKIGANEPVGRVFRARNATDEICLAEENQANSDVITTRIIWLEGLQPGLNCGGEVDSYQRYIYIHGTADEQHIGQPASIGCIRMKNIDVLEVFDQVEEGDLVIIE